MGSCRHTCWTRLWKRDDEIVLDVSDRLTRILDNVPNRNQPAGLVVLIGNHHKRLTLAKLGIPDETPKAHRTQGEFHFHAPLPQGHEEGLILVADGDQPVHNRVPWTRPATRCHHITSKPFARNETPAKMVDVASSLFHKALWPFADVVCLFVTDVGGVDRAIGILKTWLAEGPPSTSTIQALLLLAVDEAEGAELKAAIGLLRRRELASALSERFRDLHVVILPAGTLDGGPQTRLRSRVGGHRQTLDRRILGCLKANQVRRRQLGHLFSAAHTVEFLRASADRIGTLAWEPFDFVKASRIYHPVPSGLEEHLRNFLNQIHARKLPMREFAIPMTASSLVLNQYPPGMHDFNPRKVYHTLFRTACSRAYEQSVWAQAGHWLPVSDYLDTLRDEMVTQFNRYRVLGSSEALHRQNMVKHRDDWALSPSQKTCLSCLCRPSQYSFSCGHSICPVCVRIFYRRSEADPAVWDIDSCILCGAQTDGISVRMKPDTATARVLSLDGGGARAVAPLEFLRALEHAVDLPYPVQRNFDVVYGTSSGAMSVCALCINGWSVDECIQYLEILPKLAFQRHALAQHCLDFFKKIPIMTSFLEILLSLAAGSKYSPDQLEAVLKDVYGPHQSIVDSTTAYEMGAMVGVTLTTVREGKTVIVTNYDGSGEREEDIDYHVIRPKQGLRNIPLWEILRCGTAAPYFFPLFYIEGEGFQDGGLTYNNPAPIAIDEVAALYPSTPDPSIVVSLGTGTPHQEQTGASKARPSWADWFPVRIFRVFCGQNDCNKAWNQLLSHKKGRQRGDFFRFDVEFSGDQPLLDDLSCLDDITKATREAVLSSDAMDQLARCIRAEYFLFELDPASPPTWVNGAHECVGHITCRLRAPTLEYKTFMEQLDRCGASFRCRGRSVSGDFHGFRKDLSDSDDNSENDGNDNDSNHGNFYTQVRFRVPSRHEPIHILLWEESVGAYNIAGSPFTLERLIHEQKLEARFGTADHRKRPVGDEGIASKAKNQNPSEPRANVPPAGGRKRTSGDATQQHGNRRKFAKLQ
ncbi:Fc.00g082180.m01.CDS01 [Cosmosporella sp. VM-42]